MKATPSQLAPAAPRARRRLRIALAPTLCLLVIALPACVEERVISVKGGLTGLPGAVGGVEPDAPPARGTAGVQGNDWEALLNRFPGAGPPDSARSAPGPMLRVTRDDGTVELVRRAPGHVMFHLTQLLASKEHDLLFDQLLAERTKQAYRARGLDPRDAITFLARHEQAIADLFAAMPMAENTPGVSLETIGRNEFRLRPGSAAALDLTFTALDVVIEDGRFKLLMLVRR